MATIINVKGKKMKKAKTKTASARKKIDWYGVKAKVHKGCRIVIFRALEAVILFLDLSIVCLTIGNSLIPMLAYDMSEGFGLTQDTNFYIAFASWMLPMLFYTILITAAAFCVLRKFIKWLHSKFTAKINKPDMTEKESLE